jgi:hypothetical protein
LTSLAFQEVHINFFIDKTKKIAQKIVTINSEKKRQQIIAQVTVGLRQKLVMEERREEKKKKINKTNIGEHEKPFVKCLENVMCRAFVCRADSTRLYKNFPPI